MAQNKRRNRDTRASSSSNMKPFYIVLALIAVIGIGAIVYSTTRGGGGMATAPQEITLQNADSLLALAEGITMGEETAPVRVMVFSDFQCGACGVWSTRIEPNLKAEFIETGKVRYTYYDFPITSIHAHAFLAARAGRCANDQGRFWEFHDRVFAYQNSWAFSQSPPVDEFTQYATEAGLDGDAFESCLRSDRHADVVTANLMLAEQLGVNSTPTVYVGQRRLGDEWQNYEAVRAAIQAAGGV